jgi:hypothetical protein
MSSSRNVIPDFKFGDAAQGNPSTIQQCSPLESYIVSYMDGQGKQQTRIVFRVPGSDSVFMIQERINGVNVATSVHDWFGKALSAKLQTTEPQEDVESV